MEHDGTTARFVVWSGRNFDDKTVDWVEKFHRKFGPCQGLDALRLVNTRVSRGGQAKLQGLLPNTRIEAFSKAQVEADPSLGYPPGKYEF